MEIVDTLVPISSKNVHFTVNTALNKVQTTLPPTGAFMINSARYSKFVENDNLILLSGGYYIPDGFATTIADSLSDSIPVFPELQIFVCTTAGVEKATLPGLGYQGSFLVPFENFEVALNVFSDVNSVAVGGAFKLEAYMYFNDIRISMINVPDKLNTVVYHIFPFIKVLHNFPMIP